LWHRIWQPSPDEPLDFEKTIEATVLDLHKRFNVRACLYDPWQMAGSAQKLSRAGVKMQEFPQSPGNMTEACQHLYKLVRGRNLIMYPDANIRLAISRAVAVETLRGMRIAKEKQAHKIDVVIALAMAALAAVQHQSSYDGTMQGLEGLRDFYTGLAGYDPVPPDRTGRRSLWSHPMLIGRRGF
jgi:phage terminase large subunit-like protein